MIRLLRLFAVIALALLPACQSEPSGETPAAQPTGLQEKASGESVAVEVNSRAPAFAAKALGGGTVRLSDFIGNHVVLVEFWSIFCKSCIQEMPAIKELHNKYKAEGLAILSVNTDVFSDKKVASVLTKAGIRFDYPVLRDTRQEIVEAYNVELLPVTVIIDRAGYIRLYQEGYRPGDEARFEETIKKLLRIEREEDVTLAPHEGVTAFAPAGTRLIQEGKLPHPVEFFTLDGGKATLGGKRPVLLFFWSLYCRPCRADFPEMQALRKHYGQLGVDVYSVNVDNHRLAERVMKFLKPYPDLPCIPDWAEMGQGNMAASFGVAATPSLVLIDAGGEIVLAQEGVHDMTQLEDKIRSLGQK